MSQLAQALNVDHNISNLLVQRGIYTFEDAKNFFRPSLSNLHDPFLMKDMDKAISRINNAFSNDEKILVYGDYDVDGTTAVALVYTFLKRFYPNVDFYSGIIYRALGFPREMMTVMFAIGRLPGWIAQWREMRLNHEPIGRPRQLYTGEPLRPFKPFEER